VYLHAGAPVDRQRCLRQTLADWVVVTRIAYVEISLRNMHEITCAFYPLTPTLSRKERE
jgi:hypothetical protein